MAAEMNGGTVTETFPERYLGMLNTAALIMMTSIGHQTGLFDHMSRMAPSTSTEIAQNANLNERYVREWLGAMVTGDFIDYDPSERKYHLPAEHAAWLTRAAGIDNLAVQSQYIPVLAQVEDDIIECFRNGGGVPYARFPRFQKLMAEESGAVHDTALVEVILPLAPGLVDSLEKGIDAADIGCGSGHAINLMAKRFPNSRFTGFDFSDEGIAVGRAEADELGLQNARFEVRDVTSLDIDARFDLITAFDTIHDQAHPAAVLAGIARALKPGGTFLMVDIAASSEVHENIDHPLGPLLYTVSCMHCMTVSLALGGDGLGTVWGHQTAERMLAEAGFDQIEIKNVEGDIFNNYYVAVKTPQEDWASGSHAESYR